MSTERRQGVDPYAFDPQWYLQAYPDIRSADPNRDPYEHYLRHGQAEGRARNALEASGALNFQEGNQAPPPDRNPRLDPNDPASWARYQEAAHASTEGLNRMPRVLGDTANLPRDPIATQRQFYPMGPAAGGPGGTAGAAERAGAMGGVGVDGSIYGPGYTENTPRFTGNALSGGLMMREPVQNLGMGVLPTRLRK